MRIAMDHLHMSASAYDRILKVARTIADLEDSPHVQRHHIMEPSPTATSTAAAISICKNIS